MRHLHIPTLLMHVLLIVLAALTINDYPGFFLGVSAAVLLVHLGCVIKNSGSYFPAHSAGVALHMLVQYLGIVHGDSGAFGLGGGGFALFFFNIALAVSFCAVSLIGIIRFCRKK